MSKHVLVVDDDPAIRKSFVIALADTDCQVDTAESGEQAIEDASGSKYDLIFLDLDLPGINGVETLREIRKIDRKTPVYIVTAFHTDCFADIKTAVEDRVAFEVLRKPLGSEEIRMVTGSVPGQVETAGEVCNV